MARFPELTQHFAPDWNQPAACVDLWITLSHSDNKIEVTLEGLHLKDLAQRYSDIDLSRPCEHALTGSGELADRVETVTNMLMLALQVAAANK